MATFNKGIWVGNLTATPELKYTSGGIAVTKFSLAVNYRTGKGDAKKDGVDFFDVEAFDKVAELISQYLKKGSPVLIEGRLKQDRWEDEHGNKRSRVKIVATAVQFLCGKKDDDGSGSDDDGQHKDSSYGDAAPF